MVQKPTAAAGPARRPGRGRPPSFDREQVVAGALRAFWANGFEATTLAQLEEATGADRSTLYNSFEGKSGLYRRAAEVYVDLVESEIFAPLTAGAGGLRDVVDFLGRLDGHVRSADHPPGCLIVNDLAGQVPDQQATRRYLAHLAEGLRAALSRAAGAGEIAEASIDERARLLVAGVVGVNVTARHDAPDPTAASRMLAALGAQVAAWSVAEHDDPAG